MLLLITSNSPSESATNLPDYRLFNDLGYTVKVLQRTLKEHTEWGIVQPKVTRDLYLDKLSWSTWAGAKTDNFEWLVRYAECILVNIDSRELALLSNAYYFTETKLAKHISWLYHLRIQIDREFPQPYLFSDPLPINIDESILFMKNYCSKAKWSNIKPSWM